MTFALGNGHRRPGLNSQLSVLLVLSLDFDLGQAENGLNDHRTLNVLLDLQSIPHVPSFSFFYVPKTRFWTTKFFQELTRFFP